MKTIIFYFAVISILGISTASATSLKFKNVIKYTDTNLIEKSIDVNISMRDIAKAGIHAATEAAAIPVAIASASAMGVTAGTGTAISTLSGAAAMSATSAAIGAPVATAITAVTGVVLAPAVVGVVVITGVAAGVAYGFNELFLDED